VFVDITSGAIVALSEEDIDAIETGDPDALGISEEDLKRCGRLASRRRSSK
jgi:hypothetical protein